MTDYTKRSQQAIDADRYCVIVEGSTLQSSTTSTSVSNAMLELTLTATGLHHVRALSLDESVYKASGQLQKLTIPLKLAPEWLEDRVSEELSFSRKRRTKRIISTRPIK